MEKIAMTPPAVAYSDVLVRRGRKVQSPETLVGSIVTGAGTSFTSFEPLSSLYQGACPEQRQLPAVLEARLSELSNLVANWDSYGAFPLRRTVIERVRSYLHPLLGQGVPVPYLVPSSSGSVIACWAGRDVDIELEIHPDLDDSIMARVGPNVIEYDGFLEDIDPEKLSFVEDALSQLVVGDTDWTIRTACGFFWTMDRRRRDL
jgi:hypothetical protein